MRQLCVKAILLIVVARVSFPVDTRRKTAHPFGCAVRLERLVIIVSRADSRSCRGTTQLRETVLERRPTALELCDSAETRDVGRPHATMLADVSSRLILELRADELVPLLRALDGPLDVVGDLAQFHVADLALRVLELRDRSGDPETGLLDLRSGLDLLRLLESLHHLHELHSLGDGVDVDGIRVHVCDALGTIGPPRQSRIALVAVARVSFPV